jgi:hypothetical protein
MTLTCAALAPSRLARGSVGRASAAVTCHHHPLRAIGCVACVSCDASFGPSTSGRQHAAPAHSGRGGTPCHAQHAMRPRRRMAAVVPRCGSQQQQQVNGPPGGTHNAVEQIAAAESVAQLKHALLRAKATLHAAGGTTTNASVASSGSSSTTNTTSASAGDDAAAGLPPAWLAAAAAACVRVYRSVVPLSQPAYRDHTRP